MRKLLFLFILATLCGCRALYPSMMLETDSKYQYTPLPDSITSLEYTISPNDFVNFRLFSNDGFRLIDFTSIADNTNSSLQYATAGVDYLVEKDGYVTFPTIGRTKLAGLTIRAATAFLEKLFTPYYVKPYILLKVTNRRVIIFPGSPGAAKVITLINNNTTLIEALATAGGITEDGKAWQIKVIRGDPNKPQVYLVDLSTIYGIKSANMILQANDIVYVTPQRRVAAKLLERITPALSLLTSAVSILLTIALLQSTKL